MANIKCITRMIRESKRIISKAVFVTLKQFNNDVMNNHWVSNWVTINASGFSLKDFCVHLIDNPAQSLGFRHGLDGKKRKKCGRHASPFRCQISIGRKTHKHTYINTYKTYSHALSLSLNIYIYIYYKNLTIHDIHIFTHTHDSIHGLYMNIYIYMVPPP